MSRLDRGPDKYARPDLRHKAMRLKALAADDIELATIAQDGEVLAAMTYWRDLALQLGEGLVGAMDRLDDAEALLEGGGR